MAVSPVWFRPHLWDNNLSIARGACSVKMVEMFKKVTGAAHVHVFHHQLCATKDNADGNGFNTSVQPYAMAVHSDSSRHAAEEAFLRFAGNVVDAKFWKGRFVCINAWRNITTDPIENNHLAVCDETSLVSPDDNLASDLFMSGDAVWSERPQCGEASLVLLPEDAHG